MRGRYAFDGISSFSAHFTLRRSDVRRAGSFGISNSTIQVPPRPFAMNGLFFAESNFPPVTVFESEATGGEAVVRPCVEMTELAAAPASFAP